MRFSLLFAVVLLAGCLPASAPVPVQGTEPSFRPEVFFDGPSHGDPTLSIRTKGTQRLHVQSVGATQPDGTFRLDQHITYPDGRAEDRTWMMTPLGDGRYTTTLTPDASGPVDVRAEGNRFTIRYPMSRMTTMEQTITLRPGGQVADNVATVRMMGMTVARITEVITRDSEQRVPETSSAASVDARIR